MFFHLFDGDGPVNDLRLGAKIGLIIAVLVATAIAIAAVGYNQMGMVSDRLQHLADVTLKEVDYGAQIRQDLGQSRRSEFRAILSDKDKDSAEFISQAREASKRVDRSLKELTDLIDRDPTSADKKTLERFARLCRQAVRRPGLRCDSAEKLRRFLPSPRLGPKTSAKASSAAGDAHEFCFASPARRPGPALMPGAASERALVLAPGSGDLSRRSCSRTPSSCAMPRSSSGSTTWPRPSVST